MADITISDLELAPALADDMVFPVENTTDTYAATLEMLRRLINKTFVEVENADFNALTDDGFYQCTGTPTNSPVAGAINWTLQVSAESGVVVQRAFSLDDNFANLYIRRWNGVTWTGWLEVGKGALDKKANVSNTVTTDTVQMISGSKRFTQPSAGMSIELTADTNQQTVPATNTLRQIGLYRNSTYTKGDGFTSWLQARRGSDGLSTTELYTRRFLDGDSKEILNYLRVSITPGGTPISYTVTPPVGVVGKEIVTAEWVNTKVGGFANTNASNFTATGKQTIVGWGIPDYSAEVTISNNYTAPSDGFIFCGVSGNGSQGTTINGHLVAVTYNTGASGSFPQLCLPVSKGDVFNTNSGLNWARFYPLKGV